MRPVIIIHYDEIALKGRNRIDFEKKLVANIEEKMKRLNLKHTIRRLYGRIKMECDYEKHRQEIAELLKKTFGIANFGFALRTSNDILQMEQAALRLLGKKKFDSFRVSASRQNKNFKHDSQYINERIGRAIVEKMDKKVNLNNPRAELFIEVLHDSTFVYINKTAGSGGLPAKIGPKTISLLSGGIDSPVATWYAQKRGLETVLVHFHSYPFTNIAAVEKIREIVHCLNDYEPRLTLYMCPFGELQKQIIYRVPEDYRIIFYRRFMYKIAEKIAKKEEALALVSGDSIGQVASQTLENIVCAQRGVGMPILRPLVGFDKKDIIFQARKIGTYQSSILPHDDCCTLFMPKNPVTKANWEEIQASENNLEVNTMIERVVEQSEKEIIFK